MSITSFSKPSDTEVLHKFINNSNIIGFVGKGIVVQNENETKYIRTVKIKLHKEEVLQNVIFVKNGIKWLFKSIENDTSINHTKEDFLVK